MTGSQVSRLGTSPEEGIKAPVVVASIADITLSGEQTVNSVAVVDGDRVLVKSQTDTTENGIYDASTGAWSRSTDFNEARDVVNGVLVLAANDGTLYQAVISGDWDPGVSVVTFIEILEFTPAGSGFIPLTGTAVGVPITGILEFDVGGLGTWSVTQGDFFGNNALILGATGNDSAFYVTVIDSLGASSVLTFDPNGKLSTTSETVAGDANGVYVTKGYFDSLVPAGVADNIQRFNGTNWVTTDVLTISDAGVVEVSGQMNVGAALAVTGNIASAELGAGNGNYAGIGTYGILLDSGVPIGGSGTTWGSITGTLTNQTDLQAVLDLKANTAITMSAGDGLSGGGTLASNRTFNVDTTVVRTTGDQSIAGEKTFTDASTTVQSLSVINNIGIGALGPGDGNYAGIGAFGIITDSGVAIGGGGGGAAWGGITGTLPNQTDLQAALDGKVDTTGAQNIGGDKTFTGTTTTVQALASINNIAAAALASGNGNYAGIGAFGIITDSGIPINGSVWGSITGTLSNQSDLQAALDAKPATTITMSAGDGLTGGGTLASNRTFNVGAGSGISVSANAVAVDNTVVRTSGTQTVGGTKTFTATNTNVTNIVATTNLSAGALTPTGPLYAGSFGIITVTNPSSRHLKKDFNLITGSLDRLEHLIPTQFRMKADATGRLHHAFIAQEAGPIFPELATQDESGEYVTFNHMDLIAHLVDAVNELSAIVKRIK